MPCSGEERSHALFAVFCDGNRYSHWIKQRDRYGPGDEAGRIRLFSPVRIRMHRPDSPQRGAIQLGLEKDSLKLVWPGSNGADHATLPVLRLGFPKRERAIC